MLPRLGTSENNAADWGRQMADQNAIDWTGGPPGTPRRAPLSLRTTYKRCPTPHRVACRFAASYAPR
jgi:hypothetical protein